MIQNIAAFVTKSALWAPVATVSALAAAGVSELIIMLNDFSADREPTEFRTHDPEKLALLALVARERGLVVSLCTWVMPHAVYIEGMAEQLPPLMVACKARRLWLDAEEPWTRAVDPLGYQDAAARIRSALGCTKLGLSAIVRCPAAPIAPLADICDVWGPQCYATTNEGSSDPDKIVGVALERWTRKFAPPPLAPPRYQVALAAYSLPHDESALAYLYPPVRDCMEAGVTSVAYWAHGALLGNSAVSSFTRALSESGCPTPQRPPPEVMPTLDIAAMPSSIEVAEVRTAQLDLQRHHEGAEQGAPYTSPGPIDGKPGPQTLSATRSFQEYTSGLAVDGIIGVQTWTALYAPAGGQ